MKPELIREESSPGDQAAKIAEAVPTPGGVEPAGRDRVLASVWEARGVWLVVIAYAAALWAMLLLQDPSARGLAVLLLVFASGIAIRVWHRQSWAPPFGAHPRPMSVDGLQVERFLCLGGMLGALGTFLLIGAQWDPNTTESFGLAGWLWLGSMCLLIASTAAWPRTGGTARGAALVARVGGKGDAAVGDVVGSEATGQIEGQSNALVVAQRVSEPGDQPWTLWEVVIFTGVVVLAFGLRLWDLTQYPFAIHGDEIITGTIAMQDFGGPQQISLFSTTWYGIDLPTLWFKGILMSLQVGNYTLAALRLPAALFGAATVLPVYALIRGTWGRAAAMAGGVILAVSASDIHYSRVTLNNIVTPFFWAVCFFFLVRGLRTRRPLDWALAGMAGGLSEYFYYGTRLLPILLLVFMAYLLVVHWREGWRYLGDFSFTAVGYVVAFGPLLFYFLHNPDLYIGRGAGVITWNHIPGSWDDLVLMWNTLWPLMQQNLLTFSTLPANDSVYFAPLLMPMEAALLALGVAVLVWRWRHPAAFLILLAGVGVLFVGGTLVPGPGFIAHWTPAFPAFYVAIAVPIGAWATSGWKMLRGKWRAAIPATVLAVVALVGYLNVDFYFNRYYAVRPEFEIRAYQSRVQADLGTNYIVRNVGTTWQPYDGTTNSYLIKGQDGAQITDPAHELPLANTQGKGLAFFFLPDNEQNLPLVKALYPGGTLRNVLAHDGKTHLFYVYMLTPEQARGK